MGIFDNLKNVKNVFYESDAPAAVPTTPVASATPTVAPTSVAPVGVSGGAAVMYAPTSQITIQPVNGVAAPYTAPTPITMQSPGFNQETYDKIMTVLDKNNIEGFDYHEFRQSILNAASMPLAESDKFNTIFAMAKAFGVTKEKLISSIDFYIAKLDEHKIGFMAYIQSMRDQEIATREQKKANNELSIQQKSDMIRQLSEEINVLTQENTVISTEIYTQSSQITAKEQSFIITLDVVLKQINDDKSKIEMYILPETKQGV